MLLAAPFNSTTKRILDAAVEEHRTIGPGLLESTYLECLESELDDRRIRYQRPRTVPLIYKGRPLITTYRVDLVIEEIVIVEVKSHASTVAIHEAQVITYLKLTGCPVGLLINFNVTRLMDGVKRLLNPNVRSKPAEEAVRKESPLPPFPPCVINMEFVLTTLQLAQRIERAEIDFCAVLARVGDPNGAGALEVGGGRAVCGEPGLPMNKVLGLGLGAEVTDEDLDALEAFYDERASPIQIELCPLATRGLSARLTKRGYELLGFESEMARPGPFRPFNASGASAIRIEGTAGAHDEDLWNRVVSEGFIAAEDTPMIAPPADVLAATSGIMRGFVHPGITRYLAFVDADAAGGCASFQSDGVLGIFGTATLPRYRRRGVQTALVSRALNDASPEVDLAIATTEAGSTSQRTFERLGFRLLYTRAILIRA